MQQTGLDKTGTFCYPTSINAMKACFARGILPALAACASSAQAALLRMAFSKNTISNRARGFATRARTY